jgi:hypothetical protein
VSCRAHRLKSHADDARTTASAASAIRWLPRDVSIKSVLPLASQGDNRRNRQSSAAEPWGGSPSPLCEEYSIADTVLEWHQGHA